MIEIAFDCVDHRLVFDTNDGRRRTLALVPMSVADSCGEVMRALRELAVPVRIWPMSWARSKRRPSVR